MLHLDTSSPFQTTTSDFSSSPFSSLLVQPSPSRETCGESCSEVNDMTPKSKEPSVRVKLNHPTTQVIREVSEGMRL